eukprot:3594905-Rhodomonas_salina.2
MDSFSKEMLRVGTLRGFVNFSCYLRGREELLITISKKPAVTSEDGADPNTAPLQVNPSPSRSAAAPDRCRLRWALAASCVMSVRFAITNR